MADTVISTLYPPLIETFQPAFLYNTNALITFSLSPFNTITDIQSIHISVVDQRNNTNVLQTTKDPIQQEDDNKEITEYYFGITNGILIAEIPQFNYDSQDVQKNGLFLYDPINNLYAINISPNLLANREEDGYWNNNQYYQVQIRFDSCEASVWHNNGEFSADFVKYMLDKREYFSEWSSVTLIKPILEPVISINQLSSTELNQTYPGTFHISGCIVFDTEASNKDGISKPETERLQLYKITAVLNDEIIYDSDWIYARQNIGNENYTTIDNLIYLSPTKVTKNNVVIINIYCKTNNGYVFQKNYNLTIQEYVTSLTNVRWNTWSNENDTDEARNTIDVNQEDGIAKIVFSADSCDWNGTIYFKRACSKDNFANWELIYQYQYKSNTVLEIPFNDYTIGSLYQYQYSAQMCMTENNKEIWGEIFFSKEIYPKFYDMLLMRQNKQIAIRYNGQVASWKPTVNRQKIDTLGGRYPKFVENASMNYKTYSISGLITAEEDFNRTFLSELNDANVGYYDNEFNTQYIIRNDSAADGEISYDNLNQPHGYHNNITVTGIDLYKDERNEFSGQLNNQHDSYPHNHWYWEREFREQLVEWLNDGEPKLYRSMPEGNMAVMLTDINLTPNTQLGRLTYNFNATMYEIGNGYLLEELDKLKIINIPRPDAIFLTDDSFDSTNDNENTSTKIHQLGQIVISSTSNINNWINGNAISSNVSSDLWNNMSIREQLNEYYDGAYNISQDIKDIVSNSIKLKNITIQFYTPPQYFTYNDSAEEGFKFQISTNETEWLGYVINIKTNTRNSNFQQIFINSRGYYHIPDSIEIQDINILGSNIKQEAVLTYECQYQLCTDASKKLHEPLKQKTIVGQYTADTMPLNQDIMALIYQDYEKVVYINNAYNKWYLQECEGLLLDLTPYAYIRYDYAVINNNQKEIESSYLTIGQTGIFNAFEKWPLEALYILGRRMVETDDEEYPYHIEEWQYYIDTTPNLTSIENIANPQFNTVYTINGNTQIYYIDGQWYPIDIDNNSSTAIAQVPIYGMINYHGDLVKEIY